MIAPTTQQAIQAAPAPEADVVVIGRRAREWRGTFKANANGVSRDCATRHSTGDAAIDSIGCRVLVDCYAEQHPRIVTIMAQHLPHRQADAQVAALLGTTMTPCMDRRYPPLVAALAAARAGTPR